MRIDTSGNNFDNHGSAHRITNGFHNHHAAYDKSVKMSSAASNTSKAEQTSGQLSGAGIGFWRSITIGVRNLWGRIWGSSTGGMNEAGTVRGDAVDNGQVMAQIGAAEAAEGNSTPVTETHGPALAAAASVTQSALAKENPYFTAVSEKEESKAGFVQRIRIRFRELTDQFKKRFQGRFGGRMARDFSGRGALNSEQQKPKEDLRKHSRYREDGLEVDCVLTDDSYLMDSYDRSGGYSRLTTHTGAKGRSAQE